MKNSKFTNRKIFRLDAAVLKSFNLEIDSVFQYTDAILRVKSELGTFESKLILATKSNEFINTILALELFNISKILIGLIAENPMQEYVPYVLAGISYLMNANDANDDFETFDGFEDDKAVIQSIISEFNLQDYVSEELKKIISKGVSA